MDVFVASTAVGFSLWLLFFPDSWIRVSRHLRSRYGYSDTSEPQCDCAQNFRGGFFGLGRALPD